MVELQRGVYDQGNMLSEDRGTDNEVFDKAFLFCYEIESLRVLKGIRDFFTAYTIKQIERLPYAMSSLRSFSLLEYEASLKNEVMALSI
jgi:hypothetical protein